MALAQAGDFRSQRYQVLVEFHPHESVGFFRLTDIENDLSQLLAGRKIDLRTPMDLSRHFRDGVFRDALVLYADS
jgi:predicted nucleotidyltransferase